MNREPIFTWRAREAARDIGALAAGIAVVLGAGMLVAGIVLVAILARLAPFIVAVFAAIILARCTGVI